MIRRPSCSAVPTRHLPAAVVEPVLRPSAPSYSALQPGSKLVVSDDNKDADDTLSVTEYTIVGIVRSPYYLSMVQRGQTSVGNGQLGLIAYVPESAFSTDYYTDLFVTLRDTQGTGIFSDEYEAAADAGADVLEELAETQKHVRHDDLLTEANEKLADAKQELADGKAEAEAELADAYAELRRPA